MTQGVLCYESVAGIPVVHLCGVNVACVFLLFLLGVYVHVNIALCC